MSEDRRKALRTQGRFSDDFKKKSHEKVKKTPPKESASRSGKSEIMAQSYVDVLKEQPLKYTENSTYAEAFEELSTKKVPIEIKTIGEHILSESPNGISRIFYETEFLEEDEAKAWFLTLSEEIPFDKRNIIIRGEEHPQPRLVAWFGPYPYTYSGLTLQPAQIPESVMKIKHKVEQYLQLCNLNVELNSVLINLYEHGKHSIAWHSDDELTMGVQPTIASVSLGATRRFQMRKKPHLHGSDDVDTEPDYFINLTNGSLLIMNGCMQKDWQHRVPKEFHDKGPRINLTFRTVYSLDKLPAEIVTKTHDEIHESHKSSMKKTENISDGHFRWGMKVPPAETNKHFESDPSKNKINKLSSEHIDHYDPLEFPLLKDSKDSITPASANDSNLNSPAETDANEETLFDVQDKHISTDSVIESVTNVSLSDKDHIVSDDLMDRSLMKKPNEETENISDSHFRWGAIEVPSAETNKHFETDLSKNEINELSSENETSEKPMKPCPPFSNKSHPTKLTSLNVNAPSFVPKIFPKSIPPAFSGKTVNSSVKVQEKPMDEPPAVRGREPSTNTSGTCRQRPSNDLLDVFEYPDNELVGKYSFIIQEVSNSFNCSLFSERDRKELQFLCEISNDQNEENQLRICVRIRDVVMDAVQSECRRLRNSIEARCRFRNSDRQGPFQHGKNMSPRHQQQRFDKRH